MITISHFNWISELAREAELIVSDGIYECKVFSQPCDYKNGDIVEDMLHAFHVEDLVLSERNDFRVSVCEDKGFSQNFSAKVTDLEGNVVAIGEIKIELPTPIPFPVGEGDFVEFKCLRLDLW